MPTPTLDQLSAALNVLDSTVTAHAQRIARLERDAQYADARKANQPAIDQICGNYRVTLPAPGADGMIDASAVLADLRSRFGFNDGQHEKAAADRLERLLTQCGWSA
jgi:hypothetical protein